MRPGNFPLCSKRFQISLPPMAFDFALVANSINSWSSAFVYGLGFLGLLALTLALAQSGIGASVGFLPGGGAKTGANGGSISGVTCPRFLGRTFGSEDETLSGSGAGERTTAGRALFRSIGRSLFTSNNFFPMTSMRDSNSRHLFLSSSNSVLLTNGDSVRLSMITRGYASRTSERHGRELTRRPVERYAKKRHANDENGERTRQTVHDENGVVQTAKERAKALPTWTDKTLRHARPNATETRDDMTDRPR